MMIGYHDRRHQVLARHPAMQLCPHVPHGVHSCEHVLHAGQSQHWHVHHFTEDRGWKRCALQGHVGWLSGRVLSACLQVPPDYWAAIDAAAHLAKRVVVLTVPTSIIGEPLRQQQGLWQQRNKVRPGPLIPMCSGQAPGPAHA